MKEFSTSRKKWFSGRKTLFSLQELTEVLTILVAKPWCLESHVLYICRPICFEPQHSFVFVPCVQSEDCAVLPIVPPIQQPEDLLLYNPVPQVKVK